MHLCVSSIFTEVLDQAEAYFNYVILLIVNLKQWCILCM